MVSKNSFLCKDYLDSKSPNEQVDVFITASIKDHLIQKQDAFSEYVMYKLEINSNIKNWYIWKRYSDFKNLKDSISENHYIINLPSFPEKKLFNKSAETINLRKSLLTDFMNFLLGKMKIQQLKEVIDFISIDKETLNLIYRKAKLENTSSTYTSGLLSKKQISIPSYEIVNTNNNQENFYSSYLEYRLTENGGKSAYMDVIDEFLRNLSEKPKNKSVIVKTFEAFFKSKKWPQLKNEDISRLFFGDFDKNNKVYKLSGLLYHIGTIKINILGAEACLVFLEKLLQSEFNQEYDKYISILKTMKREHLENMNLAGHLEGNKFTIKQSVFKIISCLYEKNNEKLDDILKNFQLLNVFKECVKTKEMIDSTTRFDSQENLEFEEEEDKD